MRTIWQQLSKGIFSLLVLNLHHLLIWSYLKILKRPIHVQYYCVIFCRQNIDVRIWQDLKNDGAHTRWKNIVRKCVHLPSGHRVGPLLALAIALTAEVTPFNIQRNVGNGCQQELVVQAKRICTRMTRLNRGNSFLRSRTFSNVLFRSSRILLPLLE